jgi:hypothetical protein
MSLSGRLNTMDLPEVLQWVTIGRKTGSLAFVRDKTKVQIFLQDGKIISSQSNDPTKQLGQFLLFQGKITEAQLKRAFEIRLESKNILGKILVQEQMVSPEDVQQALIARTEEVIYDLFLWDDGYFHFSTNQFNAGELILITLDVNTILFEGIRRKDEWVRIRAIFPSNNVTFSIRPNVDLKTIPFTPLQKKLLYLITVNKSISEMILDLHGSDFPICYELFLLYEQDILEIKEAVQPVIQPESPSKLLSRGLELMQNQKYQEAIAVFQELIKLDPKNPWVSEQIATAENALCQAYYRASMPPGKIPYFLVPETTLMQHSFTNEEGFVASRVNGNWDIKSIVMLSPLKELVILQVIEKLARMGLIGLK